MLSNEIFKEICNHKNPGEIVSAGKPNIYSEGWMDTSDICNYLEIIYSITRFYNHPPNVLEIGVSDGTTSLAFLKALSEINVNKLISVDMSACQNLATRSVEFFGLQQWWDFRLQESDKFFASNNKKFDIIFIDGDHTYAGAKRDFDNAVKCLNQGGIILIHDAFMHSCAHEPGCSKVVYEVMKDPNYNTFVFSMPQAMAFIQRKEDMMLNYITWTQGG